MTKRKAVLLGSNGPLGDLSHTGNDVKRMAELLKREEYGFEVTKIEGYTDQFDCQKKIHEVAVDSDPLGTFIFYFSGHGEKKPGDRKLYLLIDTTNKDDIYSSSLNIDSLTEIFNNCKAKNKLLILDCCYAGAIANSFKSGSNNDNEKNSDIGNYFNSQSYLTLLASPELKTTQEIEVPYGDETFRGGVLSIYLHIGLIYQFRDIEQNNSGFISIENIRNWLTKQVRTYNSQKNPANHIPSPGIVGGGYSTDPFYINTKPISLSNNLKSKNNSLLTGNFNLPTGWLKIDEEFLKEREKKLTNNEARQYFDGAVPHWREAIDPNIPRMGIVDRIIDILEDNRTEKRLGVTVLLGATSEGKTTSLMQTVVKLVREKSGWNVGWNNNTNNGVNRNFHKINPPTNESWLLVSDNGEGIAKSVFDIVKSLHRENRVDIHFLLCCRDTDWLAVEADSWEWIKYCHFHSENLSDYINEEFGNQLLSAYEIYKSLGKLEQEEKDVRLQRLMTAIQSKANIRKRTLLGAMLRLRYDDNGFREHIKTLIDRLRQIKAPNGSLLDAFAYIAFPDADNCPQPYKLVLAEALGCDIQTLQRKVIKRLADEAVGGSSSQFVFTRDPDIAKVAIEILLSEGEFDRLTIYTTLLESAYNVFNREKYVPNLHEWQYLSSHFLKKGNNYYDLAIHLGIKVVELTPSNLGSICKLAHLYREVGYPEKSVETFRNKSNDLKFDRVTYNEWGVAERQNNNPSIGAWLSGIALSDQVEMRLDQKTASICLSVLSTTFGQLYDSYADQVFIEACGASAQLGLYKSKTNSFLLDPDPESQDNLKKSLKKSQDENVSTEHPSQNLERLKQGIIEAWKEPEEQLTNDISSADQLTFSKLAKKFFSAIAVGRVDNRKPRITFSGS